MSVVIAVAARLALAVAGLALLAACVSLAGGRSSDGRRVGCPQTPPSPWWARAMVAAVARCAAPARHSDILRRRGSDQDVRRWLAVTGTASLVTVVCIAAAERSGSRSGRRRRASADVLLEAVAGCRLGCALPGVVAGILLLPALGPSAAALGLCAAAAATLLPDALLAGGARRAAATAEQTLPETLELMAACVRGGLPIEAALEVATHHAPDPVRSVLARARRRQAAGQNPATALRVEAELVGIDEVVALGRLVDRHHQLGLPLETPLLARAEAARARAHTGALRRAGRGVPMASLVTAMVVAPCCIGILALWVISATVSRSGLF